VSLAAAHITISDEAYRLYSQYPKITSTGGERNVQATGDSGDASRASSYAVSRAQEAYSRAQAHANSFESTGAVNEQTTANHTQTSSNEDNWLEDVAKVAGWISAGAGTTAVLTAWVPEVAGVAEAVSFVTGAIAATADGVLAYEGKQSPSTVGLDIGALVLSLGVLKEGKEIVAGMKDISRAIQHSDEHFRDKAEWKTVRNIYGDLGGAIVSTASGLSSSSTSTRNEKGDDNCEESGRTIRCNV